jgi:hypothetical protein
MVLYMILRQTRAVCCGVSILQTGKGTRSNEMSFLHISEFLFNYKMVVDNCVLYSIIR